MGDRAESRRNVDVLRVGEVLQVRVGDRRADAVVVGVAVAEHQDRSHCSLLLASAGEPRRAVTPGPYCLIFTMGA